MKEKSRAIPPAKDAHFPFAATFPDASCCLRSCHVIVWVPKSKQPLFPNRRCQSQAREHFTVSDNHKAEAPEGTGRIIQVYS